MGEPLTNFIAEENRESVQKVLDKALQVSRIFLARSRFPVREWATVRLKQAGGDARRGCASRCFAHFPRLHRFSIWACYGSGAGST